MFTAARYPVPHTSIAFGGVAGNGASARKTVETVRGDQFAGPSRAPAREDITANPCPE